MEWDCNNQFCTVRVYLVHNSERPNCPACDKPGTQATLYNLIKIEGDTLVVFLSHIAHTLDNHNRVCRSLRFAVDNGLLKIKWNEYAWTAPLGDVMTGDAAR